MTSLKKLFLAFTVFGASAAAQAADSNFVGLSFGQTSDKINKSTAQQQPGPPERRWRDRQGQHLGHTRRSTE